MRAKLVFCTVIVLSVAGSWTAISFVYSERIERLKTTIGTHEATIKGQEAAIKNYESAAATQKAIIDDLLSTIAKLQRQIAPKSPASIISQPLAQVIKHPWVTNAEIERLRRKGRDLIAHSPEELAVMLDKGESLDPYRRKWIKIFYDFKSLQTKDLENRNFLRVIVDAHNTEPRLYFHKKTWEPQLIRLKAGDKVSAICLFQGFRGKNLLGYECEVFQMPSN